MRKSEMAWISVAVTETLLMLAMLLRAADMALTDVPLIPDPVAP
jgi:hypothetical protein